MVVLLVQEVVVKVRLLNMKNILFYILCFFSVYGFSQDQLSKVLEKYNTEEVPYISVHELAMPKTNAAYFRC